MARLPDEVSPRAAAGRLGAHLNTIYRWIELARADAGGRLRRIDVRTDATGHHWIKRAAVEAIEKST